MVAYKTIPLSNNKYSALTMAFVYDKQTGKLRTGISRKSRFEKSDNVKKAKKIALGRAFKRPFAIDNIGENLKSEDVFSEIDARKLQLIVFNDHEQYFKERLSEIKMNVR